MRPALGISISAFVLTPDGMVKCDSVKSGQPVVILKGGEVTIGPVKSIDRGLCCRIMRLHTDAGACLCAGAGTWLGESTISEAEYAKVMVSDGNDFLFDRVKKVEHLNFCQHVIHFYCGNDSYIFAGSPGGKVVAVSASFMERG